MSDYIKITDYAAKDNLLTGNPAKLVKGAEIGADFDAVAVAVATKANTADKLSVFAATTSAELKGVISDETGSGALVFADTPTLVTPVLGVATATSINKVTITAPATSATLTVANGKTLTASNTLTLAGTDGTTLTFQGTDTYVGRGTTDTLTNKSISGSTNTLSNIGNAALTNSSVTIGSTSVSLGGTVTTIAGLTLTTPNIGAATGSSLNLGTGALTAGSGTFSGLVSTSLSANGAVSAVFTSNNTGTGAGVGSKLNLQNNGTDVARLQWSYNGSAFTTDVLSYGSVTISPGNNAGSNTTVGTFSSTGLAVTGIVTPEADNTRTLGTGALRWSTVYAGTGTINTSDAREKTAVRSLTADEITASKQLSKEIGAYRWLASVAEKGDAAREHIGLTVQRAIEIMESNGLNPMAYGFICYDSWEDVFVDHPAIEAVEATFDEEDKELTPAIEAKDAWTEHTQVAGDRYSFRMDELNLFIAAGFEARLAALESK